MLSTVVGLNDGADEHNKWVRVVRDLEELCERRPGDRRSHAEELVRNRSNNDMDAQVPDGDRQLLGREGAHERRTINQIRRVQSLARGTAESERRAEAGMFHVRPSKLVVPSGAEPASMFEPSTWAMACPDLFPWGDGVPFLRRDTALDAPEVFRYLLLREELHYILCEDEAAARPMLPRWSLSESLLPVMYDVSRRLHLMRATKAHVQRRGFGKHCKLIAGVSVEHLLKAMALHGESADVRKLLQDDAVDLPLKRALGGVLQATASIIGMEGHRSQIRFCSHAAGWHYGTPHLFVTPNLADVRSPLLLQLHLQNDGAAEVEEFAIALDWSQEAPDMPTAAAMRRVIARDPVSQARFFALMMDIFFEEVLGVLPPLWRESYRVGYAREFEDGMATSLSGGVFGDVAAFCGPLETQGSQKVARDLVSFWVSTLDTNFVTVFKRDVFAPAL